MARDVALRELDQATFRIINLGDPRAVGDATKTDNVSAPRPNSGAGAPGESLLAAPADHSHPATESTGGATICVDDPSYQTVTGGTEEVVSEIFLDFSSIPVPELKVLLAGIVKVTAGNGTFKVRLGGTPGLPDGTLVASMTTVSPAFIGGEGFGTHVVNPGNRQLLKITGLADTPDGVAHIYGKSVQVGPFLGE